MDNKTLSTLSNEHFGKTDSIATFLSSALKMQYVNTYNWLKSFSQKLCILLVKMVY